MSKAKQLAQQNLALKSELTTCIQMHDAKVDVLNKTQDHMTELVAQLKKVTDFTQVLLGHYYEAAEVVYELSAFELDCEEELKHKINRVVNQYIEPPDRDWETKLA